MILSIFCIILSNAISYDLIGYFKFYCKIILDRSDKSLELRIGDD